jgi:pantetheine-phosphate adenylyltransferase
MKTRKAVFPGSFDPITNGHLDIIRRMAPFFDELIILIGRATAKECLADLEERRELVDEVIKDIKGVRADIGEGLTAAYAKEHDCQFILRGLRGGVDVDYELGMATMNRRLEPGIETMLVFSQPELSSISSSFIKEVVLNGGPVSDLVPPVVEEFLRKKLLAPKA